VHAEIGWYRSGEIPDVVLCSALVQMNPPNNKPNNKTTWIPPGPALLFCPADRDERYDKAATAADMVILDLEDGVAAHDKAKAREVLVGSNLDPTRTIVRVNQAGTADHKADLEALSNTNYELVMLAKSESVSDLRRLPFRVIGLCETPFGVLRASELAATENVVALMWGAEDLTATLGGRSSRKSDSTYRDVARFARIQVLLAARAHGRIAIDTVHPDIADREGLRVEAEDGAASGFSATACIHPSQVTVIQQAYRPSENEEAWARDVLELAQSARGAFTSNGQMIDAPILQHAERILAQVNRSRPSQ
jgi:citrate lyase subunit beta/citryl-CoA lyase